MNTASGQGNARKCFGRVIWLTREVPADIRKRCRGVSMEKVIWLVITIPCSLLFTGIGIYAWRRRKPMWFWSGSSVKEEEITDVKAYNRENGIMWICYSAVFWISTVMGIWNVSTAGIVLAVGCLGGIPLLVIAYNRIYRKYKRRGI